uniref:C2H2-type domain-containing protein n=1 Tax=Ditylenchus dipsaci TaxID=166011 RepID=A0A915CTR0_9BILA
MDSSPAALSTASDPAASMQSSAPATLSLPCNICSLVFNDAIQLQTHWMQSHWSQAMSSMQQQNTCSRPFVCKECDAGFTTQEALNSHQLTHNSK